ASNGEASANGFCSVGSDIFQFSRRLCRPSSQCLQQDPRDRGGDDPKTDYPRTRRSSGRGARRVESFTHANAAPREARGAVDAPLRKVPCSAVAADRNTRAALADVQLHAREYAERPAESQWHYVQLSLPL